MKKTLHAGRFLSLLDDNGWEFVKRRNCTGIVCIIAMTDDRKVLLVEQTRRALGKKVIEFPAGLVNDRPGFARESFETAARRELLEEAGYTARKWEFLMEGPVSPGLSGEVVTFYKATGLKKKHNGGGDPTEDITVHAVTLEKIPAWLKKMEKKGKVYDPKIFAGLYFLA